MDVVLYANELASVSVRSPGQPKLIDRDKPSPGVPGIHLMRVSLVYMSQARRLRSW